MNGSLFVTAAGQAGKALFPQQDRKCIDADGVGFLGQLPLDVVDREVALTHGYGQLADRVASGGRTGTVLRQAEETGALVRVVAKLMTEHAESTRRIAEAPSRLGGGEIFDEEGAEGLVLALERLLGRSEEVSCLGISYAFTSTDTHDPSMLQKHTEHKLFVGDAGKTS